MSKKIEPKNLEIRKTRNDFSFQVRNLLLSLSKRFRHKERGTIFLFWLFYLPPSPTRMAPATKVSASKRKPTVFFWGRSQLSDFFKISPNPLRSSDAWHHPHSVTPLPMWAIVTSLSDTSAPPTRTRTPVLILHLTNPCAEPKGSQPN